MDRMPPPRTESPRAMRLVAATPVAASTSLFAFEPVDGGALTPAAAGAHVDIHLPGGLVRQYSLVLGDDEGHARYTIGVKRAPDSRGGSRALHDELAVGCVVPVAGPRNTFPLVEEALHTTLVAGGIGVTPILSMWRRLRRLGRSVELHYAARSRAEMAFREELAVHADVHLHIDNEAGCPLDVAAICAAVSADAHLYCCGPGPMLAAFEAATADRPRDRVHVEYFSARRQAAGGGFEVELARSGLVLPVAAGARIIDVVRGAGVDVPTSCEEGVCGSCETRVLAGEPDHRCEVLSEADRRAGRSMMICCGGALGRRLVLDL